MNPRLQQFAFCIRNAADNTVDIFIDGFIVDASTQKFFKEFWGDDTFVSYKSFRNQLDEVTASTYNVYINSGGGDVIEAQAIHDLLVDLQIKGKTVNTIGRGIVASAATYILMASNNAVLSENSWFMIHNVSGGIAGNVNEIESYAGTLRKFNNQARDFYAKATGIRKEDITKMMDAETWLTAPEAKEKGFVKQVTTKASFTNSIKQEHWQFKDTAVLAAYNSAVGLPPARDNSFTQQFEEMKKFWNDLGATIMNAIKGVKAPENNDHAALMTSIGEAVNTSFTNAAESLDTEITNVVSAGITNALKGQAFTDAVNTAVTNATKDLTTKVTNLETTNANLVKKNGELEQEITNLKGKATNSNEDKDAPKPVGSFNKN